MTSAREHIFDKVRVSIIWEIFEVISPIQTRTKEKIREPIARQINTITLSSQRVIWREYINRLLNDRQRLNNIRI